MVVSDSDREFKKDEKVTFDAPDYQKIPATVVGFSRNKQDIHIRFGKPVKIDAEDQGFYPSRTYKKASVPEFTLIKKTKLKRLS